MWRIAWRGVVARRLRLALTATAIVIGVGFVAGTLVLTDTLNATFDSIFGNADKRIAVVVRGQQAFAGNTEGSATSERALVPAAVLDRVRAVPGVAHAIGVANGYAQLVYAGKAVQNGAAPNLGTAWSGAVPENPLRLERGAAPTRPGEVAIDEKSAARFHIPLGANAHVIVSGRILPVRVVGFVSFGGSTLAGATITAFPPAQAQRLLLGAPGQWTTVQASAVPGLSQEQLRDRVATALGDPRLLVQTEHAYAADQADQIKSQLAFFDIVLLVFAFISVFVAVFIIFNTFTVLVAQRTRELALLRALGARRRQVLGAVTAEAVVVGFAAGAAGLGLGIAVAAGLRALITALGGSFDTVTLQVRPRTVLVALVVGVLVTAAAAIVPAIRASRIPPVAAMRDDYVLPTASLRRRTRLGSVALAIGAVLLTLGVRGGQATEIGLGAILLFRGVIALSPMLGRPLLAGAGSVLARLWQAPGRLARENALRNPRRTAATASALMIGVALTSTMSVLASSITTSAAAAIDESVGADFIVTAAHFAPISDGIADRIRQVPGVGAVTSFRVGSMKVAGGITQVQGVTAATVSQTLRLTPRAGTVTGLAPGGLLVSESTASAHHWAVGTTVPVSFALTGPQTLRLQGIYAKNPIAGDYLIAMPTYEANFRNRLDIVVAATAAPGAPLGTVRQGLAHALAAAPAVTLRDQSEFKQDQKRQINQVLVFVLALLLLSLVIAWLGIVNTLALSVIERTREIGLLRAVGMSRRQVRRMVRLEAVVIAVFGALLGVGLGLGYGVALVQALHAQGVESTSIPAGQLVGYLVVGIVAGITAAWWPARRAARLDVLKAIATE